MFLICAVSRFSITVSPYFWAWTHQPPNKELEWKGHMCYDGHTAYSSSFRSPNAIFRDMSKIQFSPQMTSMTTKETSEYYHVKDIVVEFSVSPNTNHHFESLMTNKVISRHPDTKVSPRRR
jgi:hypothetical protein